MNFSLTPAVQRRAAQQRTIRCNRLLLCRAARILSLVLLNESRMPSMSGQSASGSTSKPKQISMSTLDQFAVSGDQLGFNLRHDAEGLRPSLG
jgi:hypothetical protein